jgi:Tfp pilus assembly protein FimT
LLELILVMVIAAFALAIVAPSLTGFSRGAQLHDQADEFIAITRLARTRAVSQSVPHRVKIDSQAGTYQLLVQQTNGDFAPLQTSQGRAFQVDDGMQIQLLGADGKATSQDYIDFFPTGRVSQATVVLTSARGETITIRSPSPAEGFIIAPPGGAN